MTKRNLFKEIKLGLKEIKAHQKGKITLRTHVFEKPTPLKLDPKLIRNTREKLNLSRAVFAMRLRVQLRTLEKWEQGKTMPNDQAIALILMTRKYPDTLNRLSKI
ncbi:MAG: helix-turn-helix domain-containing protein [Gammaproteobacteria bacterium]|jgi:putative transcriptional regulator